MKSGDERSWEARLLHEQVYDIASRVSDIASRVSSLEAWRDNQQTRHAAIPTWLFGIVGALVSAAMLALNLWLAGVRP